MKPPCTVDGCDNQGGYRDGRCKKHREGISDCVFYDCDRSQASAHEPLCISHRNQRRKGHELHPLKKYNRIHADLCAADGCDLPYFANGLCTRHEPLQRRGVPIGRKLFGDYDYPLTNRGIHSRLRALWGSASQYECIECGGDAEEWSYDGTDPTEFLGPRRYKRDGVVREGLMYHSIYPEFYAPLCRSCHRRKDGEKQSRELSEYRSWKYRTGLTLDDVTVVRRFESVA